MKAIAENIIRRTINLEGGYVNDPVDAGGETKFGISKRSYPGVDIAALTKEEAIAIYARDFWDGMNLDLINSPAVAAKIFDVAVNIGQSLAAKMVQEIVAVDADGIIGPHTANAVNAENEDWMIAQLRKKQLLHYAAIVEKNPAQIKFFVGWINRVFA